MKKRILPFLAFLFAASTAFAQTTGDIAIIGWNADNPDDIFFVTFINFPGSTDINFTDNEWDGVSDWVDQNEGFVIYTTPPGGLNAGDVILISSANDSNISVTRNGSATDAGTVQRQSGIGGSFNIGSTDDIYVYLGSSFDTPTTFLFAMTQLGWQAGDLDNTGLTDGVTALFIGDGNDDNGRYEGIRSGTTAAIKADIQDVGDNNTNFGSWFTTDGAGDQSLTFDTTPFTITDALPVELVSFTALQDHGTVLLSWETASETNNAGFEVQMQVDGRYQPLGFVDGYGTTTEAQSYQYRLEGLTPGTHRFRLKQIDFDGTFEFSPEVEVTVALIGDYTLSEAFPNPFNPVTQFTLTVSRTQHVVVSAYNLLGQQVATLFEGTLDANAPQTIRFEAADLPSGLYLYRAQGETFSATRQVTLLK